MEIDTKFDNDSLKRIERILLDHPVARRYFQGVPYDLRGSRRLGEPLSKERRAKIPMRVQPLIDIPEVRQYSTKSK
jgi:hypothetical protein